MPIDDSLVEQGNPAPQIRGEDPLLASPGSVPEESSTQLAGDRQAIFQGPTLAQWLQPSKNEPANTQDVISNKELENNQRYSQYTPGVDNESIYANSQGTLSRLGNAAVNLLGKTAAYVVQNTGFILGAPAAVATGDITNMTDNFLTRAGDALKDDVSNQFPIYKSYNYTHGSIFDKLATSSWWLDDGVDRLALTAAMFVPGLAEAKGIGAAALLEKGIQAIAESPENYSWLGKTLLPKLYKAAATGVVDDGVNPALASYAKSLSKAELYGWNIIGQSALNGRETQTAIKNSLIEDREKGNNQLSDEDINNKAAEGASKSFWETVPITLAGSLIELPQMFSTAKTAESVLNKLYNQYTGEALEQEVTQSISKLLLKAAATGVEHGQNESLQVAISRYNEESIAGKRDEKGNLVKDVRGTIPGIFGDFLDNINDPNGQNNIALGTIQGVLMTLGGRAVDKFVTRDSENKQAYLNSTLNIINSSKLARRYYNGDFTQTDDSNKPVIENGNVKLNQSELANAGLSLAGIQQMVNLRQKAAQQGDRTTLELLNHKSLSSMAYNFFADPNGIEHLSSILKIEAENAKTTPGRINDTDEHGNEITPDVQLQHNLSTIQTLKKVYDAIDQRHAGLLDLKVTKEDGKKASDFLSDLKHAQYQEASNQVFFSDKINRNNSEILSHAPTTENFIDGETKIKDVSNPIDERINSLIDENKDLKELLDVHKANYKKLIDKKEVRNAFTEGKAVQDIALEQNEIQKPFHMDEKGILSPLQEGVDYELSPSHTTAINKSNPEKTDVINPKGQTISTHDNPSEAEDQANKLSLNSLKEQKESAISSIKGLTEKLDKINDRLQAPDSEEDVKKLNEQKTSLENRISNLQKEHGNLERTEKSFPLSKVKFLGVNPVTGKLQVQDRNGDVRNITAKQLEGYSRIATEQEKLQRYKNVFFKSQDEIAQESTTPPTGSSSIDADNTPVEESKKDVSIITIATTSPSAEQSSPRIVNERVFLNSLKNFPNVKSIRALLFTKNHETQLGLTGLIDSMIEGIDINPISPDNGVVAVIYTDGINFVDKEGKSISKIGEQTQLDQIIVSTMPSASLTFKGADGKETNRYRTNQEEEAKQQFELWKEKRKEIFNSPNTQQYEFHISRGLPIYSEKIDGKTPMHSVLSLIPSKAINQEGLIQISDTGYVSHNGENIKFPIGRPVLQYGDTLQFLNNRTLTNKEQSTIFSLLNILAQDVKDTGKLQNKQATEFLRNILYWGKGKESIKPTGRNQIFIDSNFNLVLGNKEYSIPFTPESLQLNEEPLKAFLASVYNNINKDTLTKKFYEPFEEIIGVNDDGAFQTKQWKSYQEYLLSPEGRQPEAIPLTTTVRPISQSVPDDYNYKQKYAVLHGIEFPKLQETPKEEKRVELPKGDIEKRKKEISSLEKLLKIQPDKSNQEVLDKMKEELAELESPAKSNTFTTGANENISYTYEENPDTKKRKYEIVKDEEYNKYHDRLKISHPELSDDEIELNAVKLINNQYVKSLELKKTPEELEEDKIVREEIEKLKPKSLKDIKPSPNDEREFSLVNKFNSPVMSEKDYSEFKTWAEKNVPGIPFERLDNIVQAFPDRQAWGVFENNIAKFFKGAPKETPYHEIFEGIWKNFVLPEEKAPILEEMRAKKGTFTDALSNEKIEYYNATDKQLKEQLADDFAAFRIGKLKAYSIGQRIMSLFQDLIKFFQKFITGKKNLADDLFNKINIGAYKNNIIESSSIEREFKVIIENEEVTNAAIDDITTTALGLMFANNESLFNIDEIKNNSRIFDRVKERWEKDGKYDVVGKEGWDKLIKASKERLKTYGIEFDEDSNVTINTEGANKNDYAPETFTTSPKKSAPFAIKLLTYILPKTDSSLGRSSSLDLTKLKSVELGGETTSFVSSVDGSRVFATALDKLSNTSTLEKMMEKLAEIAKFNPDYERFVARLKANYQNGVIQYDKLGKDDWRLLAQFYNVFSKQKPDAQIQYIDGNNSYFGSSNLKSLTANTISEWMEGIKGLSEDSHSIIRYNKSKQLYYIKTDSVKNTDIKTPKDWTNFLEKIGIPISEDVFKKLSFADRNKASQAVAAIKSHIQKNVELSSINGRTLGISGPLNTLAELYTKTTSPNQESTFSNAENKKRQSYENSNYTSAFEDDFNQSNTLDELLSLRPELNDVFSTNSLILKKGGLFFDEQGNRIKEFKLGYADGIVETNSNSGQATSKISLGKRFTQELNHNLHGNYYVLIPADSSTEWMLNLGNNVSFSQLNNPGALQTSLNTIFQNYLRDEFALAQSNRTQIANVKEKANKLRFFSEILSPFLLEKAQKTIDNQSSVEEFISNNEKELNEDVRSFLDRKEKSLFISLKSTEEIWFNDKEGTYIYSFLDSTFAQENNINKTQISEKELNDVIKFATINYVISNIELHKAIFGDPYQFNTENGKLDETKRIKSYLSPRRKTLDTSEFNNFLNTNYNEHLKSTDVGYHQFKPYLSTITLDDIIVNSPAFKGINEADAASIISLSAFREVKIKNGQWDNKVAEVWYQYEMAYTRNSLSKSNKYEYSSQSLKERDDKILGEERPKYTLDVLKPIVSGVKYGAKTIDQVLDKFSQMPLVYSAVEGRNLESLFLKMHNEGIDYVIMESGRKVGTETKYSLYDKEGGINKEPFSNKIQVPFKYYGIQVENSFESPKLQTRGSQLTKIATIDLMQDGKATNAEHQSLLSHNQQILEELTKQGYSSLLSKLGVKDEGTYFTVEDKKAASNFLKDEITRRELSDNAKDTFELDEDGNFIIPFEASPKYTAIRDVFWSLADKSILRPKIGGSPSVQVPVTGWESLGLRKSENGKYVTSPALKNYTKAEPWVEVMLPHWMRGKWKGTDEELLNYLNTPENEEILKGVGFRIPTQSLSSALVFKVKSFLPQYMGNTVVVPTEITKIAGSDFDIDKLNTYLKNTYLSDKNVLKIVPFFGYGEEAKSKFRDLLDKIEDKEDLISTLLDRETYGNESLENFSFEEDAKKLDKQVDELYRQSLENEYFKSLNDILSLKENYDRLTNSLDSDVLKKLSDHLDELKGRQESSIKNRLLSREYMTSQRHAFITAKRWVGIGAVNITGQSLTQRTPTFVIPEIPLSLPHNEIDNHISFSGIKSKDNKYISDTLSDFITAFVDVAKDPYIIKLIPDQKFVGTWMTMVRMGIPVKDIAMFMHQPIILDSLSLSPKGIQAKYASKEKNVVVNKANFEEYIRKASNNEQFNAKEKAEQLAIYQQFNSLNNVARAMLALNMATNYDTASFRSSFDVFKKNVATARELTNNIIQSDILNTSHIGQISTSLSDYSDALGEFLKFEQPFIKQTLQDVLLPYAQNKYLKNDVYQKITQKLNNSFLDYIVQIGSTLNNDISSLMGNINTSVALEVLQAKKQFPNNPLLQNLKVENVENSPKTKSISLKVNLKEAYDENLYTGYFRELRDDSATNSLYNSLIKAAVLQGVNSNINFNNLIPIEDWSKIVTPFVNQLSQNNNLSIFNDLNLFQKNNWKDDDVVPSFSPAFWENQAFEPFFDENDNEYTLYTTPNFGSISPLGISVNSRQILLLNEKYNSRFTNLPVVKIKKIITTPKGEKINIETGLTINPRDFAIMKSKGNTSYNDYYGYQQVKYNDGTPLTIINDKGEEIYIYKQTNLLGDGNKLAEYYNSPQSSVVDNGTIKIAKELNDNDIIEAYGMKNTEQVPQEEQKQENNISPEEGTDEVPEKC